LAPLSTSVPAPALTRPPLFVTAPPTVSVLVLTVIVCDPAFRSTAFVLKFRLLVPANVKLPPIS